MAPGTSTLMPHAGTYSPRPLPPLIQKMPREFEWKADREMWVAEDDEGGAQEITRDCVVRALQRRAPLRK